MWKWVIYLFFMLGIILINCGQGEPTISANDPPATPVNVYPPNGAEHVDHFSEIYLEWECSDPEGDELRYNVYFCILGSSDLNLVSEMQSETTCVDFQRTWEYGEVYAWQIVAYDSWGNSTKSPIWYFTG